MDRRQVTKDQVINMLYSIAIFIALTAAAVCLDLISQWVKFLGVAKFTYTLVALIAHALLLLDGVLFLAALYFSARDFLRELRK